MGKSDPRLTKMGKLDFRLQRMQAAYTKDDPPPNRVKPVPVMVVRRILAIAQPTNCPFTKALADMIGLAFFFLLRPGEYTDSKSDTSPFQLQDVQLFIGQQRLNLVTATDAQLLTATFSTLTFRDQKNGVRGEVIGLSHSGDQQLSPTRILARRVIHLRNHQAPFDTPLARVYRSNGHTKSVKPADVTAALKAAVTFLGPQLGFLASDVTARSLRAAGANALLCADVDPDIIQLMGRWTSDQMLRYLTLQAAPIMKDYSRRMLAGGTFTLIPNQWVPSF